MRIRLRLNKEARGSCDDYTRIKTAAVAAGIKSDGMLDLALICSETPAVAAAVFTQNFFIAAPLILTRRHLTASAIRFEPCS